MYRTPVIINYLETIVMEKLLKIEGKNCSKYPNALHAQFHNRMHALIAGEELATLHLSDALLKEWREYIDTEVSINREAEASILSKRMLEKRRGARQTVELPLQHGEQRTAQQRR